MHTPLVIAHRGARSLAPENTLAAARAALEVGADMWELDVALSKDGIPVIMHDDSLKRTTDVVKKYPHRKPWLVKDFTLEELFSLDAGSWFNKRDPFKQIYAGAVTAETTQFYANEKIPTLLQALEFTVNAGWRVNVEIKDAHQPDAGELLIQKILEIFYQSQIQPAQVIISSFNHDYLRLCHLIDDRFSLAALVEIPVFNPHKILLESHACAFNPWRRFAPSYQVKPLVSQGYQVYPWTVNTQKEALRFYHAGVSGIITDFPQVMRQLFQKKEN